MTASLLGRRSVKAEEGAASPALRHLGAGQLLGPVMESEVVEQMAVTGGFLAVTALVELALASWVLGHGAGGWLHVLLLLLTVALTGALARRYYQRRRRWTRRRWDTKAGVGAS